MEVYGLKSVLMKFGGSSISDDEKIKQVANLIAKYYNQGVLPVVVVSAIEGVTNSLEVMAEEVKKVDTIKPEDCRKNGEKFSRENMATNYVEKYKEILLGQEW